MAKVVSIAQKRDVYLDFMKGIAAINIIFIHTTFWSGGGYVPKIIQTLSLALDVPFFFFCSGIAATYVKSFEKSISSLLNLYKKYMIFLVFYYCCLVVFGYITDDFTGITLANFIHNMFFLRTENTALRVVMGSIWFMPVYYTVVPIGSLIISRVWSFVNGDDDAFMKKSRVVLFVVFMGLIYTYLGGNFLYLSSQTLVYLFFYFLGVVCSKAKVKHAYSLLAFWGIISVSLKMCAIYLNADLSNMQALKFPPNILYVLYSLFVIVLALYARDKVKVSENNFFCWVGKSAMYFYFCQRISSSLLMYFVPGISWLWWIKLPIAFALNFSMTCMMVLLFKKMCIGVEKAMDMVMHTVLVKLKLQRRMD